MNNDGYQDLMTVESVIREPYCEKEVVSRRCMGRSIAHKLSLGFPDQFSRNCFSSIISGTQFSDVALLSGVDATEHSWSTLLADFNNDGYKDIFITNGTTTTFSMTWTTSRLQTGLNAICSTIEHTPSR